MAPFAPLPNNATDQSYLCKEEINSVRDAEVSLGKVIECFNKKAFKLENFHSILSQQCLADLKTNFNQISAFYNPPLLRYNRLDFP